MPTSLRHDPRRHAAAGTVPLLLIAGLCLGQGRLPRGNGDDRPAPAPRPSAAPQAAPAKPPPLELDADEPLLLESPTKPVAGTKKPTADNTACLVCHANFKSEELASCHASHGVACTKCHGPSEAHRNDEANIIPPDIMFATEAIDESCARCHDGHDVEPRAVIQRFLERTAGKPARPSVTCTTCHGEHRLAVRTVRWDRKTGKLLAGEKTINHSEHREKNTAKAPKH